ncbi:MAG: phosphodiesterase [Candidatus Krumholzibacteriota bacterium]|nr:phosphodiesterase [Candidatus Krumholzibacteriota bacterium]
MTRCFFVSDLHGRVSRYESLFVEIEKKAPAALFIGGDLLPHALHRSSGGPVSENFIEDFIGPRLADLKAKMGERYPRIFTILGNDDPRAEEFACHVLEREGLWSYIHEKRVELGDYTVYGYACVPPTPFHLKDWERYDVSRYVPHGSVSPEDGWRSIEVAPNVIRYATIKEDLDRLAANAPLDKAVFLFHTPPHETALDRAPLDGKMFEGVPIDLHVGSIAVRRFIEARQPLVTLHGHIHESTRLTGKWRDKLGRTEMFNASHDGKELALVEFDLDILESAERRLI